MRRGLRRITPLVAAAALALAACAPMNRGIEGGSNDTVDEQETSVDLEGSLLLNPTKSLGEQMSDCDDYTRGLNLPAGQRYEDSDGQAYCVPLSDGQKAELDSTGKSRVVNHDADCAVVSGEGVFLSDGKPARSTTGVAQTVDCNADIGEWTGDPSWLPNASGTGTNQIPCEGSRVVHDYWDPVLGKFVSKLELIYNEDYRFGGRDCEYRPEDPQEYCEQIVGLPLHLSSSPWVTGVASFEYDENGNLKEVDRFEILNCPYKLGDEDAEMILSRNLPKPEQEFSGSLEGIGLP